MYTIYYGAITYIIQSDESQITTVIIIIMCTYCHSTHKFNKNKHWYGITHVLIYVNSALLSELISIFKNVTTCSGSW